MKIGELLVEINGDNSGLNKALKSSTTDTSDAIDFMTKKITLAAVAWKAVDLAIQGIEYNKAAEQAEIAFGVFLGSAAAAKNMIEDLRDLAKETPLEFDQVRDAAKQLSAFGISANQLIPTMRMLADVSAGLNIPIGDLSYLFGTIKTQGKAMTVDLMQFANRGIPIWEELATVTGKNGAELRKIVEAGQVGFPEIEQAFRNMTSEGGKFFNMANKQMASLAGAQSNLNDSFNAWLGNLTSGVNGPLKDLSNWAADWFSKNTEQLKKKREEWKALGDWISFAFFHGKNPAYDLTQYAKDMADTWAKMDERGRAVIEARQKAEEAAAKARKDRDEAAAKDKAFWDSLKTIPDFTKLASDATGALGVKLTLNLSTMQAQADAALATAEQMKLEDDLTTRIKQDMADVTAETFAASAAANVWWEETADVEKEATKLKKAFTDFSAKAKDAGGYISSLAASARKFGATDLSNLLDQLSTLVDDAGNFAAAIGKGDYVAAAVAGVALVADAWSMFADGQKRLDEERAQAERERLEAVKTLETEYAAHFVNELDRLEQERDERVAYARSIGADVLNIERYYAGEIAKIRTKSSGTQVEESAIAEESRRIQAAYAIRVQAARDAVTAEANATKVEIALRNKTIQEQIDYLNFLGKGSAEYAVYYSELISARDNLITALSSDAVAQLNDQMRSELEAVESSLVAFQDRYSQAFEGISDSLTNALVEGTSEADFTQSIMDMLRKMAIDAAIVAGGFAEKFKEIGVMIAEALKDGFQEGEVSSIKAAISALYSDANTSIADINALFPGYADGTMSAPGGLSIVGEDGPELMNVPRGAQIVPNAQTQALLGGSLSANYSKGDTVINVQSNAPLDPLETARQIRQVQESLAFAGAY